MKTKAFLLWGLLMCICSMSFSQVSENYYSYSQQKTHYFDSLRAATPDTLKVAGMRSFQRWNDFWRDRVYNSPTEQGTFDKYATNLQAAIANPAFQPSNSANWNWQPVADQNMNTHNRGIIVSLWINPNNINEIYAGSNTAGMFRTINGGAQWECVTDNINLPSMGVQDIAVHPTNTNIKYIAHSMPFGGGAAYIHKTTDNCATWQTVLSTPISAKKAACRVVLDPVNPDIVYALMHDEVYRSMDAGATWQLIFNQLTYNSNWGGTHKMLLDIEFKPNDHNTIYITGNGFTGLTDLKIYYVLEQAINGVATSEIWRMNIDGSQPEKIIDGGRNYQPNLLEYHSPLQTTYLFYVKEQNSISNIFRCNNNGNSIIQLTANNGNNWQPRVNYDQSKLLFISDRTGLFQLYTMNIDGTNVSQITSTGITGGQNNEHMGGACWTPDGKLLYFNGSKLYKINADGSNLIEIATAPSNYWSDVRCSSTGKIAAQTQGATPYAKKIYLMNADGTGLTTLVADDPGNQTLGNFSEDGTLLYYSYDVSGHEESSGLSLNSQIFWITLDGVKKSSLSVNKPAGYNSTTPCSAGSFFEKSAEIWVSNNATGSNVNWQRIVNGLPNFCDRYSIVTNTSSPNELYFGYSVGVPGKKGYGNFEIKKINTANSSTLHIYNIEWYNFYSSPFAGLGYWSTGFELSPSNPNIMFCGGYNLEVLNMSTSNFTFFNVYASPPHPSFHVDQRVFKTATANGKTYLFCGNDGGISRYEYETETMISCNGPGLDNNQYYGIGHAEVDPDFYIGGNQDNGVVGNGSGSFKATVMGDAYEVLVDPITPNICYATANGGSKALVKSIDYFQSVKSYITPSGILGGLNDCPFEISPSDHNTLYVGYNEIYRTINATSNSVTWQKISNFQNPTNPWITTNDMKAIGLAKTDPNQIIVAFTGPTWEGANQSRLFKTTDGGTNWLDLSASLGNTIHWTSITDILVSPVDKNKIWISFAGYWTNGSGNTINKVWYSSNGGSSWVDISNTLPDLPINCMAGIMQNNEYVPMIGNDMGVFKYNATTQTWGNISNGLPHVIVADIETDFTNNMLLVGTYGRGIWKTPIPCDIPVANITVTTSIPWSQNNTIAGTVTIENNATLTITSTISMAEGSKIIVKPGSKLIVDGGTLKNACTGQWQGIEVWGTTNQHQYPINGVYAHGIVELKNGAIIENAANGITNWKPDDWNSIGGIIKAEGATFKNCRRGVEFMKYRNFHPTSGYEMDNVSYFKNCSFIVDDTYPANASPFFTGVSLWSVRGVKVSGCDFFNNKTVKGSGYGIYSLDAGYKVYAICNSQASPCPEQYLDKTWFKGFEYGINASNAETSNSVYIQDSKFTENGYGIELSSVNNAVIIKNRFEMTSATNCPNYGYGINLVNCTGYAIEENLFTVNGVPPANNWSGIETTNSGTAYNEIYKNTFQNLTTGNLADLLNATTNTIPPTGLTYLCNINTNNDYDFYVTNKPESRISYYQRSGTATAAGNSFSQGAVLNFDNGGGSQIRYYYSTGMAPPTYYGVVPVYTANANTCPTHYGGGSGNLAQLNQSQIDALEEQYAENYSAYNNVKSIYETLKDGGSTTNTVEDIETSMPSEMWELRAKLLGDSPHLSQKALTEAALKTDVLPESVLFEILSANPDELRDESFLAFLESKENPLPSYMIDLLRAIAGNTSYKTVLQEQLNAFNTQKALAASDIIRSKLNDSIVSQSDIINWFDNRGDLNSRYQMIDAYIQMGNYTAAQGMLSLIPGLNELSAADSAEYQKVCELKNLQISILNAGRNLAMLTNTEKEQLSVIADANTGIASTQAKGILGFMAGTPYCNCVRYNDELKHSMVKPSTIVNLTSVIKISVAPNPATTWITFEYSLPEKLNSVTLNITDNTGRRIETLTLTGKQGQKVLDTRSYASGAYIYQINQDKKVSGKFIIK